MFKELFDMYLGMFMAQGESALIAICNCVVPSQVVLSFYKKLSPIESMPEKEKNELKLFMQANPYLAHSSYEQVLSQYYHFETRHQGDGPCPPGRRWRR